MLSLLPILETTTEMPEIIRQLQPMFGVLLAAALSLAIGLEREYYAKSAGMRTYMLVGMGSALFTVISKYGFSDMFLTDAARYDGARVAAQVVSGIGFLGAGLIFVRRDAVRGLTTAAGIWFVAAVGMAAGAGMYWIAGASSLLYLLVMFGLRPLSARMPHAKATTRTYTIRYEDGRGILREIMEAVSKLGVKVLDLRVLGKDQVDDITVQVISITGQASVTSLDIMDDDIRELPGVVEVK